MLSGDDRAVLMMRGVGRREEEVEKGGGGSAVSESLSCVVSVVEGRADPVWIVNPLRPILGGLGRRG